MNNTHLDGLIKFVENELASHSRTYAMAVQENWVLASENETKYIQCFSILKQHLQDLKDAQEQKLKKEN